jgi:hypothetical protein
MSSNTKGGANESSTQFGTVLQGGNSIVYDFDGNLQHNTSIEIDGQISINQLQQSSKMRPI